MGHNTTTISPHLALFCAAIDSVKFCYLSFLESVVSVMFSLLDFIKNAFTDLWVPLNGVFINQLTRCFHFHKKKNLVNFQEWRYYCV